MKALITGASNGLGADFAKELSKEGYDLILVARSKDKLEKIAKEFKPKLIICGASNYSRIIDFERFAEIRNMVRQ